VRLITDNLNAVTPAGGAAGDIDSDPTGGGLLVNGATVDSASPLRSMVCDSYTHVGLMVLVSLLLTTVMPNVPVATPSLTSITSSV
jgi:hypothetical protein